MNTITKAMDVDQAYDAAHCDNISSEGCYSRAVAAAWALGGIEVYNSNDDSNRTYSFAPTRDFEFDDGSSVQVTYGGVFVILPNEPYERKTEMNITLNIGLEVSKHYLPEGVAGVHLQYEYVKQYLEQVLGTPIYIGLSQSATEKTVVAEYTNVELVLSKLFWLAHEFKQDCIAYGVQYAGRCLGGALVGEYAHEWNYGIFNEAYFLHADVA